MNLLDVLTVLSFIVGLENLRLNDEQVRNLDSHLQKQDDHLERQDRELLQIIIEQNKEIIRLLKEK